MTKLLVRFVRGGLWFIVILSLLMASIITGSRLLLPHLDNYRQPIEQWVSKQANISFSLADIDGRWQTAGPSLTLEGIEIASNSHAQSLVNIGKVELYFDVWDSLLRLRPIFKQVEINRFKLDLTQLTPSSSSSTDNVTLAHRLEQLFFTRLGQFKLTDSSVVLNTPAEHSQQLNIGSLDWLNIDGRHLAQGTISLANSQLGQLAIKANMIEQGSFASLSGQLYVKGQHLSVTPWLNQHFAGVANIKHSDVGLEAWLNIKDGHIIDSKAKISNSSIDWHIGKQHHQIQINHGLIGLRPIRLADGSNSWRIDTEQFAINTDKVSWPQFGISGQLSFDEYSALKQWKLAVSNIELQRLLPLVNFLPPENNIVNAIKQLQPSGLLTHILVAGDREHIPRFSFNVEKLSVKQWQWVPGINHLNASIAGDGQQGKITLDLQHQHLPYTRVFAKPLKINQADIHAYWFRKEGDLTLWSDQLHINTPDLDFSGQARVDISNHAPTWLSLYGHSSIKNAGQTWRYLPRPALGHKLSDYLSQAIQGGQAKSAQVLWYGALDAFPYQHHDGVFQAFVPLTQAKFSFDPHWPVLRNLQLDLLFENAKMYLHSQRVTTLQAQGSNVVGDADLTADGHLKLSLDLAATGKQVHDYMLKSPLASSVGCALTAVNVEGPVTAKLYLDIPFDSDDVDVHGKVYLKNNTLSLNTPPLTIKQVNGVLNFTNTAIFAKGLSGRLYQQPVQFGLSGDSIKNTSDYKVDVDVDGDWQLAKLADYLPSTLLNNVTGNSHWRAKIGVVLKSTGVNYSVNAQVPLANIDSQLPAPFSLPSLSLKKALVINVDGDKQQFYAQALLPTLSYQAKVKLDADVPKIVASNFTVGQPVNKYRPLRGQVININSHYINVDRWLAFIETLRSTSNNKTSSNLAFTFPLPTKISTNIDKLILGGLTWHNVDLVARSGRGWSIKLKSQEADGYISWAKNQPVNVILKSLYLNFPQLESSSLLATSAVKTNEQLSENKISDTSLSAILASSFDKKIMALMPAMDVSIADAWLQGYRLGKVTATLAKKQNRLQLQNLQLVSGNVKLTANGEWYIHQQHNYTALNVVFSGSNSSDLFDRFGISGSVQNAPFDAHLDLNWQGSPWAIARPTLQGKTTIDIGKGIISGVSGAGRLLGLFSLDSIIRKLQLDFSGVFDNGLAFNYIRGSGTINGGVLHSNDIKMQAFAGDLFINGNVNLVDEQIDANVKFIPDFTSGLPVITAFAITPPVALYVLAISTVLSPVLDVITQVNYQVTGPIIAPKVIERSRLEGEYEVPSNNAFEVVNRKD